MLVVRLQNTDPFFCLATEEYLLKNFSEDIFMLWQSDNTVVVGKHQNALAEINYPYVRKNKVRVARRISGGGTVFHDAGNVNFSFMKSVKSPAEISFEQFTQPVTETLAILGAEATTSGRNDLLINGLKISGNAEHVYKNRVLHHGTLLFDSDLDKLREAIKVVPGKYQGKAVQSNRSKVANISPFLSKPMPCEEFIDFLFYTQVKKTGNHIYELTKADTKNIEELANEKFVVWEWRFGYSPKYTFKNMVEIGGKTLQIFLEVKKGVIEGANFSGNCPIVPSTSRVSALLAGERHSFEDIRAALKTNDQALVYAFF